MRIPALYRLPLSSPVTHPRALRWRLYSTQPSSSSPRQKFWDNPDLGGRPAVRKSIYTLGGAFFLASSGYVLYKAHEVGGAYVDVVRSGIIAEWHHCV